MPTLVFAVPGLQGGAHFPAGLPCCPILRREAAFGGLAEHFRLAPAQHILRPGIPARDPPGPVGRDDGVIRHAVDDLAVEYGGAALLGQRPVPLGHRPAEFELIHDLPGESLEREALLRRDAPGTGPGVEHA